MLKFLFSIICVFSMLILLLLCITLSVKSFTIVGSFGKKFQLKMTHIITNNDKIIPKSPRDEINNLKQQFKTFASLGVAFGLSLKALADEPVVETISIKPSVDWSSFKLPYNRENIDWKQFLGKATILFNMKIDDPQTVTQFPSLLEIYQKYSNQGLTVQGFPTEQGWFEPDDDETCREKAKVYYGFYDPPKATIFDKMDVLGPSAHPLIRALTSELPTPNGYGRITLNYEKFLLDSTGKENSLILFNSFISFIHFNRQTSS